MNLRKLRLWLFLPIAVMTLNACGNNPGKNSENESQNVCETRTPAQTNAPLPTPVTDGLKFAYADGIENKRFAGHENEVYDHMGLVTLRSCTDGDTANFIQDDYVDDTHAPITIKTRFLGINTPESTAKVEPWGKKASIFCKKILTDAQADADEHNTKNIILINNPGAAFEEKDSSGGRWLAFIWYRPTYTADWRLLNLEMVEQAYSRNYLFSDDRVCNYRDAFEQAEENVKKCGYRVHGEVDPDYDYTEKAYEYSLWYVVHHYDEIGITEEGSSGVQLVVTALVVGVQGDNMFLRDILLDEEQFQANDLVYQSLSAYAGFNSSLGSYLAAASEALEMDGTGVGIVVRFYCRAGYYNGNVQLTDVKTTTTGKKKMDFVYADNFAKYKDDFKWSHEYNEKGESFAYTDLNLNSASIRMEPTSLTDTESMGAYHYAFVNTEIVVRSVNPQQDGGDPDDEVGTGDPYWYKGYTSESKAYTVYASIIGEGGRKIYTNVRIDAFLSPFLYPVEFGTNDATDLTSAQLITKLANDYPFSITAGVSNTTMVAETGQETYSFGVTWPYEQGNDALDTTWGINAADYKANYPSNSSISLRIKIIITQTPTS